MEQIIVSKLNFLKSVRNFLEFHWLEAHVSWGNVPPILSKHMCIYTCIFLKKILRDKYSEDWQIVLGRPTRKDDKTCNGMFGYKTTDNKWHDHAWLSHKRDIIIDLTGDQFGGVPIYIGPCKKTTYNPNLTEENISSMLEKLQRRVTPWLEAWKNFQNLNNKI